MARMALPIIVLASLLSACGGEPIRPRVVVDHPAAEVMTTPYPVAIVRGRTEHADVLLFGLELDDRTLSFEVGQGHSLVFVAVPEAVEPASIAWPDGTEAAPPSPSEGLAARIAALGLGDAATVGPGGQVAVITLPEAEGPAPSAIVGQLAGAGGDVRFLITVRPGDATWPGDAESFERFKTEEVAAYRQARESDQPYRPTRADFLVAPRRNGGFAVLEWPAEPGQRVDASWFEEASLTTGQTGQPVVVYDVKEERQAAFHTWTRAHVGLRMAIVLDGQVLSDPTIQAPLRDSIQISLGGGGTYADLKKQAASIARALNIGPRDVPAALAIAATWRADQTFELVVPIEDREIRLALGAIDAAGRESSPVKRTLQGRPHVNAPIEDAVDAVLAASQLGLLGLGEAADHLRPFEDAAVAELARQIRHPDTAEAERLFAVQVLPRLDSSSGAVVGALATVSTDATSVAVRQEAVSALAKLARADAEAGAHLRVALDDPAPDVRRLAALALLQQEVGRKETLAFLVERAADDPEGVLAALRDMWGMPRLEALDLLVERSRHAEAKHRRVAALLLATSREQRARDALLARIEDADADVRQAAVSSLAFRQQVLNEGAPDIPIDVVVRHLESAHLETRAWALSALGGYGDAGRAHAPTLQGFLDDPEEMIRASAAWALIRLEVKDEKAQRIVDELMRRAEQLER